MTTVEFEDLLRACSLGALLPDERVRLDRLAGRDRDRARRVAEVDAVLDAFVMESELLESVSGASDPAEEGDPTQQRLTAVAASAEGELRTRLEHPVMVTGGGGLSTQSRSILRRRIGYAILAAAAALLVWFAINGGLFSSAGAGLDTQKPDDLRAGRQLQLVLLQPTLSADARTISWAAVPGASGYHARILDGSGAVVLERDDTLQKSTAWELTPEEYAALLPQRPLRLRVTALDGVDLPIGSSGDLSLTLR